jgi:hypothetical protein
MPVRLRRQLISMLLVAAYLSATIFVTAPVAYAAPSKMSGMMHVHQGGQAIVGNVKGGDMAVVTKPAPPLAIVQEQSGMTLEDLIGRQPERVGREGV